jgi:hypothetical protein
MKQTFRSKIGLEIVIPMGGILAAVLVLMLVQGAWQGVLIIVIVLAFAVHLFVTTYYVIDGDKLRVKCGFLINTTIDINSITKIVSTKSILSAPAISFDRLEVFYNKYDSVVISPGDKEDFIENLKQVNEGIVSSP